ncbi:MAG: pyridoxamine 5'-phosphate oxidase family protein [Kiloniellales bacterium]|nr:pyridoxamine 5'-phosphate oxidase family protein [Kiloniellales bacterium]
MDDQAPAAAAEEPSGDFQPTPRTRLRRLHERGHYDRETVNAILDAGLVCHVGYVIDGQPYVTATAYWRLGGRVYWHGSSASKMLRHQKAGVPVCFTVSLLDGLVLARSGFHSSINYRSVMALGEAHLVADRDEKLAALAAFSDRLTPGRWPDLKPPSEQELKATTVISLELDEVAAKVRSGPPKDDPEDLSLPVWAGVVPVASVLGRPEADPLLSPEIPEPDYLRHISIG